MVILNLGLSTRGHSRSSEGVSDCHSGGRVALSKRQVEVKGAVFNVQQRSGPSLRPESRRAGPTHGPW